ncbi:hypothetical protein C8F01DRAFT_1049268, partial [Mycena amicta]
MHDRANAWDPWDVREYAACKDEQILRFLESLQLYQQSTALSIILFELGEFSSDPVLRERVSSIFTPTNKFLVNTSGSGKTRLCYEGLCANWGFYITLKIDSGRLGSLDAEHRLSSFEQDFYGHPDSGKLDRNVEKITTYFQSILLARLLLLLLYLETLEIDSSSFTGTHKKHWLSIQLVPNKISHLGTEPFDELSRILVKHDSTHLAQNIHTALNQIRSILGEEEPLFIVLDEASLAVEKFSGAFGSNSLLQIIIQAEWENREGGGSPRQVDQVFFSVQVKWAGSDFGWTSNSGAFDDPVRQEEYIAKFLPSTLRDSPSGRFLIARAWRWLRGRHRATATFIEVLLLEGLEHPHTLLDYFIDRAIFSKSVDAVEYVAAEGRTALWDAGFHTFTFCTMSEENKRLFLEILFRYMATHDASPPLGPDRMELVFIDFARVADAALSEIVLDEPLPLLGVARKFLPNPKPPMYVGWEPTEPPATFLQSLRLNIPPNEESLSPCLVFYLTQVLGTGRHLNKVFSFPHPTPDWAKQPAELVRFHRLDSDEVSWSPVGSDDFESFHPLAKQTASVEETLQWLEHRHGTAFCLPSSTNVDLLFVVRLADESFVWVVLKALASDEPVHPPQFQTALSQLQVESLFGAELQSRLETALDSLPNLGSCRILRVISSFPVEITVLKESVSKGTNDAAVLSLSRLESKPDQVMQTDFFDAIAAGVLAGHKRKSRWDDG